MALFRRIRIGFPFYAVGADDPVRPQELPVFTETRCEFETFQWADVGIGPYERPHKISRFWRADRVVRPYKGYWIDRVDHAKNRRVSRFAPGRADVGIGPYK